MTSATATASPDEEKAPTAFKTISEVSQELGVPQHVLRFWESKFPQIKPLYRSGRRYYRPEDVDVLVKIQHLLKKKGYTIKGAKKAFKQIDDAFEDKEPQAPPPSQKPALTDKQHSQLAVIRQELISLRETLKPYVDA